FVFHLTASGTKRILAQSNIVITDPTAQDTLVFDVNSTITSATTLKTMVTGMATVRDAGLHKAVTINFDTTGAGHVTIELDGIGTGKITSLSALSKVVKLAFI